MGDEPRNVKDYINGEEVAHKRKNMGEGMNTFKWK